jgi:OOP family OmpA-OmpF porin
MNKAFVVTAAAIFGMAGLAPGTASAQENPEGLYVGAGWGQFNLGIDNLSEAGSAISSIAKSDDNAWKVFAGYRFNPYIAIEAAYIDFGHPSDRFEATGANGNYRVALSGFAPSLIGTVPVGPVELFAKLGYYYYNVDVRVDFDTPGPSLDSSHSGSDLIYGGGVGLTLADHLQLRAEYEVVDLDRGNSDAVWLSAAWRF